MSRKTKHTLMQKKGMMFMYPEIKSKRHNGEENIISADGENITAIAPLYREDIESYEDLAEEVIRIYGYEHIVPQHLGAGHILT